MSQPYKPVGLPGLMPYIFVTDPKASIEFYHDAFGFEPDGKPLLQDGKIVHAEMTFLDTKIMLGQEGKWGSLAQTPKHAGREQGIGLYVYCEDVQAQYEKAKAAGAEIKSELETMFWGDTMFRVLDLDGYSWTFAQNTAEFDPSQIPEDMK